MDALEKYNTLRDKYNNLDAKAIKNGDALTEFQNQWQFIYDSFALLAGEVSELQNKQ